MNTRIKVGYICAACRSRLNGSPYCSKDHAYIGSPVRRQKGYGGKRPHPSGKTGSAGKKR